jgi:hypothetical protein
LIGTKSKYLRGYGEVSKPLADFLDPDIDELIEHLTKISETMRE